VAVSAAVHIGTSSFGIESAAELSGTVEVFWSLSVWSIGAGVTSTVLLDSAELSEELELSSPSRS